jgi:hypothetical protein
MPQLFTILHHMHSRAGAWGQDKNSIFFSALGGNFKQSVRELVVEPFKFTWIRPLGKGI